MEEQTGSKISDFVVSSYTPTLTTLINSFRPIKSQKTQLLTVALPSESGLPGTQKELEKIEQHAKGLSVLQLFESRATVESVSKAMAESSWVHFACHGIQDTSNPTESALQLAGSSELTLSKITKFALPHADLAFLSACQTATGDEFLQEEAVHLAAGMLLAGYRTVIATMWSIVDNDAPQVAGDIYSHLFKTSPPDSTQAAIALCLAVRKLRESKPRKSLLSWVPFIHMGA